ncbi:MAG: acetate/propionate family kinase [Halieaceae bacterium]|jgi:acetate kinase|nr:acetate/propionate family kinase [Halieaceae bacterium]
MAILAVNAGSSSLKFALFSSDELADMVRGELAPIGQDSGATATLRTTLPGATTRRDAGRLSCVGSAVDWLAAYLEAECSHRITAVGHRIVHGGTIFRQATLLDEAALQALRDLDALAPLHNPTSRQAVLTLKRELPDALHVGVFDTTFHGSMPAKAQRYALPSALYSEHGIRRFGFHGISHGYLAARVATLLGKPQESLRLITLHLGNGASVAAIRGGGSVDTSMGFTPLEGLVMGTRAGDIDASIPLYLQAQLGLTASAVDTMLNRESGLLALAGTADMREIEARRAAGDEAATLAFDLFCYRARKYLGAYLAVLEGADAIVFSGGIGQHSAAVREAICGGLSRLGVALNSATNARARADCFVHDERSETAIAVLATDEEREIARQTAAVLLRMQAPL